MKRHFSPVLKLLQLLVLLVTFIMMVQGLTIEPGLAVSPLHTVTFYENASASDAVSSFQTENVATNLTLFSALNPSFTKPGSTFVGWNTSPSGNGLSYADGATYSFNVDLSLYAQWVSLPVVHVVTFYENASLADQTSAFQSESGATDLTTFANLSTVFSNNGETFLDWNTSSDGSGTAYSDGSIFSFAADLSLYAQWSPAKSEVVSFNTNGGVGTVSSILVASGGHLTIPAPTGLTDTGYTFANWNTSANGTGTTFTPGQTFTPTSSQTLFAQWSPDVFEVTYVPDGGTLSATSASFTFGSNALTLPSPTRPGFTFAGWFTEANGGSLVGAASSAYSPTSNTSLYAQWNASTRNTVTFNPNGASGSIGSDAVAPGSTITMPGQSGLLRAGFKLTGWNTSPKGTGTSYKIGQAVTVNASFTVYAQWSGHAPAILLTAIGTFSHNSAVLTTTLKNQILHVARTVQSQHYSSVTLYGYTPSTGLASLNASISTSRAIAVASYLREALQRLHVTHVMIRAAGEGAIPGETSAAYSRVEVFVA